MQIESRKVSVQKSAEDLCTFLSNVENFEQLMPENISKFEVLNENSFVFALKGMPEIGLEVKDVDSPHKVSLGAISDKIPFDLSGSIEETGESSSNARLTFSGEFNPMMAMMIKGPITKFLETLVSNMEKL
jgi:hypothetical protein